ncbi:MAG TPA: NB-ARC domain-containing protein [Ktedonobacteraceae bacterium]|jgi:WD40 repeat protein/transcriptional regulator with XRE-family HTH domain|nr:NB-ARC domain-containing protein [Ktedonobacteraceae bacterium]
MNKILPAWSVILKQERNKRGWSQNDVATKLICDSKTIGRWERGEAFPGRYLIQQLTELYQKDVAALGLLDVLEQGQRDGSKNVSARKNIHGIEGDLVPEIEAFYGRTTQIELLKRWMVREQSRMVILLGIGGMGKTLLARMIADNVKESFARIIWISLRNAPALEMVLERCLHQLLESQTIQSEQTLDGQISLLIRVFQQQRCLLIVDNVEVVLQEKHQGSYFHADDSAYDRFFQRIGETSHQSCLLLTSQEKPVSIARLEGPNSTVHSLLLSGLEQEDCLQLLHAQGLQCSQEELVKLIDIYAGNPLALKLVSASVRETFQGDVSSFLQQGEFVFGDVQQLLHKQFLRLSAHEQELLFWLAIEREAVKIPILRADIVASKQVVTTIESLRRRSLLEVLPEQGFTLQPVVMEYVTQQLIERMSTWLKAGSLDQFGRYALIKATSSDYIRQSQIRFILAPVADHFLNTFGLIKSREILISFFQQLRTAHQAESVYPAGNILNLLIYLHADLRGVDCSQLMVRQAYFRGVELPLVNFTDADLKSCVFTDTFTCILCLAISPDGKLLAAGTTTGEIRIWNLNDAMPIFSASEHTEEILSVAFSPDGRFLASGSDDHSVRLWNLSTGRSQRLSGHGDAVRAVAFSSDGYLLASGSEDHRVRVWNAITGECIRELRVHSARVRSLSFHPFQQLLATGGDDTTVLVWNCVSWEIVARCNAHNEPIRALSYSPDGRLLACGSEDATVSLWECSKDYALLRKLTGHTERVRTLTFGEDSTILVTGSDDLTIHLWDLTTYQVLKTLSGHSRRIWSVVQHPGSNILVSASEDDTLRYWDTRTGLCQQLVRGYTDLIKAVAIHPDGVSIASGSEDTTVRVWNSQAVQLYKVMRGHRNRVRTIAFSPDGQHLASGSEDETIRLWSVENGNLLRELRGHTHLVRSIAFDTTGQHLLSGGYDGSVRVWNVSTGQVRNVFAMHYGRIWSVAISPERELVALGCDDPVVVLLDSQTGLVQQEWTGHTHRVWTVTFSPDGQLLASGSDDLSIRIWKVASGECLHILKGHESWVRSIAFSPDGTRLVSCSHDLTLRLWDLGTGSCIRIIKGHQAWIWSVVWSPDGSTIVSGSDDGTVKIWSAESGRCKSTLRRERPYEGMNVTRVKGISEAQKEALLLLGAKMEA